MTSISKFTKTSKKLRTTFEAFKFPASDTVQFRALITPCLSSCKPVQCSLLNTETGINQEFVSYGRRKRRRDANPQSGRSSPATSSSSSSSSGIQGTMYETLGEEEHRKSGTGPPIRRSSAAAAVDSSPDVVVVGAIRITENFAAFESSREGEDEGSGGGGDKNPAGNYSQLSSLSGSDAASNSGAGDEGSSGSHNADDCSNMMGLIIACVIFLSGQSILLLAWIYMHRMSSVYRSKFFASSSAFSAPSDADSQVAASKSIMMNSPSRHAASSCTFGVPSTAKRFPHCYSFPFASSPASPESPAGSSAAASPTSVNKVRSSMSPSSRSTGTASSSSSHAIPPHKVAEFMSKRNFSHP